MSPRGAWAVGMDAPVTELLASCSNCASWRHTAAVGGHATTDGVGYCGKGMFPDADALLCQKGYEPTHAFKQQIISTMLKEQGPMALPVKLVGGRKSAREMNRKLKRRT